ncbi:MAG: NTP transferase domain-containing protein [Elusimicrobia bacterium]|nr:NTP transferase domain-containing protein [Elusimicrobiota bacterium]
MSTVYNIDRLPTVSPSAELARQWTALIPAAGRGSRLGAEGPKILFPVLGRPMLDWIVDLVRPFCERIVIVVSAEGRKEIQKRLKELVGGRGETALQPEPIGMADAVARGLENVRTPHTLVLWGDQVTPTVGTLARCLRLHMESGARLTLPTIVRADPYIHFERFPDGRLKSVYQRREADRPLAEGENDCGLFLFQTEALRGLLAEERPEATGAKTREKNLLALFPYLDRSEGDVVSVRISDATETLGVNTPDDLRAVEAVLRGRKVSS